MYRFVSALVAVAVLLAGCSSDNGNGPPSTNGSGNGTDDDGSPPAKLPKAHNDALAKLSELGVQVWGPDQKKAPKEDFSKVQFVGLVGPKCEATDEHLVLLKQLEWIDREGFPRSLHIRDNPQIGDRGLAHLANLALIDGELNLSGSGRITDTGLKHLSGFDCNTVVLRNMKISDAGLANLQGLKTLTLLLEGSRGVTEAGLRHLSGIRDLRQVQFDESQITEAGRERAKKMLPGVVIVRSPVKAK